MYILRRTLATLLTVAALCAPAVASACGSMVHGIDAYFRPDYGDGGIIQTPLSIKGHFIFVERMSRRTLLQVIAERQDLYRPASVARAQI